MDVPTGVPLEPPDVSTMRDSQFGAPGTPDGDSPRPSTQFGSAQPKPGQLSVAWQIMVGVTWAAVFFAFAATWKASEEIGIATWWLGPRAQPEPLVVNLIPFALSVLVGLIAVYNVRHVALISLGGSILVAVIATFDITRSGGLAAIEFAIAGAAALVSLAALTGNYRTVQLGSDPN